VREVVDKDQEYTTKNPLNVANGNGADSGSDESEYQGNNRGRGREQPLRGARGGRGAGSGV
jgi:hypothetical protein